MRINDRMARGCVGAVLLAGMLAGNGVPASATNRVPDQARSSATSSVPRGVCLNTSSGNFAYRTTPRHCNFYDAGAPGSRIIKSAILATSGVKWNHWGTKTAFGAGRYRESGGWLRMRVRLDRPRVACGQDVFTRIRMDIKTCGGDWTGWGAPMAIERCA